MALSARLRVVLFSSLALLFVSRTTSAASLTGHVVDPDGRAVAGAHVIVSSSLGKIAEPATDAAGAFSLANLAAGTYDVRVVADGFQADPARVALAADQAGQVSIALRISALTESVVVSASQIDVPLSQAPDSVTVVTSADLETRQVETVSDALRAVPGLAVIRSGGRGALTSLFPRGGNSNYTLVLVDGIRANSFGGGYDFAHLSVTNVDHVEIVRGPESALFGSDAIGGVVQVVTRRGGPTRASGVFEGGGQNTFRETVDASGGRGYWGWGGGAEHTSSDGFTGLAANGQRVSNDDYSLSHVSGSLSYEKPRGVDFAATGSVGRDERGFPGPYGSNPIGVFPGVDVVSRGVNDTRQVGARFGHPWSDRVRQRLEASYTDVAGQFTSQYGPSFSGTHRFDGRIQEDISLNPALGASAGLEYQRERGTSTFITGSTGATIPIDRSVAGVFGELRYARASRLFVTGGVRFEHITRDALQSDPNGFPPRPAFPDQTVNSANPKLAVSYLLTDPAVAKSGASTRLRASAGTGIRPPDAFEVAFTNNPNLKPERSRSVDLGVEQQFGGGSYVVAGTVFFNQYDDLIVTVGKSIANASQYQTDNISNARARGLELSGDARLPRGFTVRANYTFLASEILSIDNLPQSAPAPFSVGDPLIRRPRHQGTLDLTYTMGRFGAFADVLMRSKTLDIEPNFGAFGGLFDSPGYTVVNAGASVRLERRFEVYGRIINLGGRVYEESLGFPALGRQAMAGVRVATGR